MNKTRQVAAIPLREPLYRGKRRLRIALVGMPNSGKSTLFNAVSSTSIRTGELGGTRRAYNECAVQIGLDEARVVELPSIQTLHDLPPDDLVALQYLLWGDELPPVKVHEPGAPPAPFAPPDVIIQVMDATALARHLELTLELSQLGRPMVIALNMMDEAWKKGLHIKPAALSRQLGIPVVPTVALMGQGIAKLFKTAVEAVRGKACPLPHPASKHLCEKLQPLSQALNRPEIQTAFRVPHPLLVMQLAQNDSYFRAEMQQHFPELLPQLMQLRSAAEQALPRPLAEELHADRHHRAAMLVESVTRLGAPHPGRGWRYWLDELFLHPQWGLLGSLAVFAVVLFVVFEVSVWIDSVTSARLVEWISPWQPQSTGGVIGRAVADGLIGLIGIVVPYMIPLVLLLVALEESGIMQRIAFVVDRGFHHLGLHGGVAVPFLTGLGCNVPALSAASRVTRGRERLIASLLITFVPCSARSAIILAIAGKYLGGLGVFAIFLLSMIVIALLGKFLTRRYPESGPGQVQEIPSYALPRLATLLPATWERTRDILTIVTPLLVGGSVVLALLSHVGADDAINTAFTPITVWWLGLPALLGVPILFGVLRKELSLLMVYQALGTFDIGAHLDWVQIMTFLIFLTFYFPCVSTFAVMLKTIGRRQALASVSLSIGVALVVSGIVRWVLVGVQQVGA
ncbi:nucleoside recognition domain-containing protein [Sulfuricaulis limicola]|uniref:Ferrous iron transport protein B n=1 Tax=Sulfuricaulis limicola TaxID=1620215 RepID=A0A1B4XDQ7_9GAMM|nr:ferrous iron transporter B [Sulfuricaulis limicola]BAV32912.1 nucleoside recognition domain-containing protein [Sulfuricaulis limicola]